MKRIVVYHGEGEGKTSAALGHVVRYLGHESGSALIVFFMKGRESGEYQFLEKLRHAGYPVKTVLCGPPEFLVGDENREEHQRGVIFGINQIREHLAHHRKALVVMDEVLYAVNYNLIEREGLMEILRQEGEYIFVLTGRNPPHDIVEIADIVTHFQLEKHHYYRNGITDPEVDL